MLDTLKAEWRLCALVSIVFALLVPLVSSTVLVSGSQGEVVDFDAVPEGLSESDVSSSIQGLPSRRLEGLEKLTYQFQHPQFFRFYLNSAALSFVWFFLATLLVSHFGRRRRNAD